MGIIGGLGLVLFGFIIGVMDAVAGGGNLLTASFLGLAGLPALQTIATMQVVTLLQTTAAALFFNREKLVNWRQALLFIPFAVIGSFFGARVTLQINPTLLSYIVGGLMLLLLFFIPQVKEKEFAISQIIERLRRKLDSRRPLITRSVVKGALLMVLTLLLGFYGGFYGGSVGTLMLLSFYFIGQADIMATAATTKVIDIAMSAIASYVYFTQPSLIVWSFGLPLIGGALIGSWAGVKWAQKLGYQYIRFIMYIVVASAAVKFIAFPG